MNRLYLFILPIFLLLELAATKTSILNYSKNHYPNTKTSQSEIHAKILSQKSQHIRFALKNGLSLPYLLSVGISIKELIASGVPISQLYGINFNGGLIFYVDGTTGNGLVAAPSDHITEAAWGCFSTDIISLDNVFQTNPTSLIEGKGANLFDGADNTQAILSECHETDIAAYICANYFVNGYNDWFLPSIHELYLMYKNIGPGALTTNSNSGNFDELFYWSSSEYNSGQAWVQDFKTGLQRAFHKRGKIGHNYIRAVRAFSSVSGLNNDFNKDLLLAQAICQCDNSPSPFLINSALSNGYTLIDLLSAGSEVRSLVEAGINVTDLVAASVNMDDLLSSGISVSDLLSAGASLTDLVSAGASTSELLSAGISVSDLLSEGVSVANLNSAGVSVRDLRSAGASLSELILAGAPISDLLADGVSIIQLLSAGANTTDFYGLTYQGGIIFHITSEGHGLVAAPVDLRSKSWGCMRTELTTVNIVTLNPPKGQGAELFHGEENTRKILDECSNTSFAAKIAASYRGGSFTDWYLPSILELQAIHLNIGLGSPKSNIGNIREDWYWSSTQNSTNNAWSLYFKSPVKITPRSKSSPSSIFVRPVRKF